jgi:hypothetical protein
MSTLPPQNPLEALSSSGTPLSVKHGILVHSTVHGVSYREGCLQKQISTITADVAPFIFIIALAIVGFTFTCSALLPESDAFVSGSLANPS